MSIHKRKRNVIIRNGKKQEKQTKTGKNKGSEATVKGRELNDFLVHLSFLQLICKASLIFKSNLEVALKMIHSKFKIIVHIKTQFLMI